MLRRLFATTSLSAVVLLLWLSFAAATPPNVVDQYTEQIPTLSGPQEADKPTGGSTQSPPSRAQLPPSRAQLNQAGGSSSQAPVDLGTAGGGSPTSGVRERDQAETDNPDQTWTSGFDSGMGLAFPLSLLLLSAASIGVLLARRGSGV